MMSFKHVEDIYLQQIITRSHGHVKVDIYNIYAFTNEVLVTTHGKASKGFFT